MAALICGSLAYDTVMVYPGRFRDHILPEKIHLLNVSFVVPTLRRYFGGCAGNIAYNLRLLETAARATGQLRPFIGETDIFITPGFRFRAVDMLMTNFHLPKSTLFMLVSAFSGLETMKAAYAHAIAHGYRFYSYGDSSLLHRAPHPEDDA